MSKNLEAKLGTLLNDTEQFSQEDRLSALVDFLRNEIGMMEKIHFWNNRDLTQIRSRAVGLMREMNSTETLEGETVYQNSEVIQAYCYAQATYEYMRSKKMTPYVIGIQRQKSKTIQCEHEGRPVGHDGVLTGWQCRHCQADLEPRLWVEVLRKK